MDKKTQRAKIRFRPESLPLEYCQMADKAICHRILTLKEYQEAPFIFCYISINREVDIRPVSEDAWALGKRVAVIPCMSCDRMGNRLGHGAGYYDRYPLDTNFLTATACRAQLILKHVYYESHDQPVDLVITESQIYRFTPTRRKPGNI